MKLNKPTAKITIDEAEFLLSGLRNLYAAGSNAVKKEIKFLAGTVLYVASETRCADYVSKSVCGVCVQNGIGGDLKNMTISKQRANKKKIPVLNELLLEHCTPLSMIFDEIFEQGKDIKSVLNEQLKTAWITKDEDRRLNQSGYKSARPNGWQKCYAACGIEI